MLIGKNNADSSAFPATKQMYEKHSPLSRLLHWSNFVTIAVLLWTALLLLSGTPELSWSHWLPAGFYSTFQLDGRNDEGRVWHVLFSFVMIAITAAYAANLTISGSWRTLLPNTASWRDAYLVVLHDLGLSHHRPLLLKYNGAQRVAYTAVLLMCLGEIITGLPIYFKSWVGFASILGGQTAMRFEHFVLMLGIIAFIAIHLIQVARAGWNNFRAMVIGIEVVHGPVLSRPSVVQALADPAHLTPPLSVPSVEATVRQKSRRGFALAALLAVLLLGFIGFARSQSAGADRIPPWLNWARDTGSADTNHQTNTERGNITASLPKGQR